MLKRILNIEGINTLKKKSQKNIKGGMIPFPVEVCFCITRNPFSGNLEISEEVPCDSICEDGSRPFRNGNIPY